MYYKAVLTYDFSDDDTRDSFCDLIMGMGFLEASDQSTFKLPLKCPLSRIDLEREIKEWSLEEDVIITEDDFIQFFYAVPAPYEGKKVAGIESRYMSYQTGEFK